MSHEARTGASGEEPDDSASDGPERGGMPLVLRLSGGRKAPSSSTLAVGLCSFFYIFFSSCFLFCGLSFILSIDLFVVHIFLKIWMCRRVWRTSIYTLLYHLLLVYLYNNSTGIASYDVSQDYTGSQVHIQVHIRVEVICCVYVRTDIVYTCRTHCYRITDRERPERIASPDGHSKDDL